ncbi:serine/threonine-protein kinase [Streptomyces longispororuber]|uniref:serine/threonine-protein kinase n=1 Tax=Streptomyces longispororuber TaxID=68230 RepID=UPI00210AA239|nr:serine/threonine-protein kinase [Streptomyces longispororuber]MCQ4206822.1 serine/threonine protein kinase [Streptomyces longispororuber]
MARGERVGGRYRLVALLGRGGMGEVHEAEDLELGRRVAVKLLNAVGGMEPDGEAMERFRREARAMARIEHPGVVTLYDSGLHKGTAYLVMQVLDGRNLAHLVAATGALPVSAASWIAQGMARALAVAHQSGVLHRDIKPSNVILTRDGRVVLHDFGLARLAGERAITAAGVVLGSPQFMAPEAIKGGLAKASADLYGLGACLYFMLTGESPLGPVVDVGAVVERALGPGVPRLSGRADGPPGELAALVDRLCAQDPEERPREAAEVAEALEAFTAGGQEYVTDRLTALQRDHAVRTAQGVRLTKGPEYAWDEVAVPGPRGEDPAPVKARPAHARGGETPTLSDHTRRMVLGSMSSETALSRQREAVNLVQRGELEAAARMLAAVVPVCVARLGPDHPTTLTSQYWQAVCLARLDAGREALELLARVNRYVDRRRGAASD